MACSTHSLCCSVHGLFNSPLVLLCAWPVRLTACAALCMAWSNSPLVLLCAWPVQLTACAALCMACSTHRFCCSVHGLFNSPLVLLCAWPGPTHRLCCSVHGLVQAQWWSHHGHHLGCAAPSHQVDKQHKRPCVQACKGDAVVACIITPSLTHKRKDLRKDLHDSPTSVKICMTHPQS
jgi:hypothetical protein